MNYFLIFPLVRLTGVLVNPLFAADEQRQAYDKMVEEATREADAYVEQKQKEQREAAEARKDMPTDASLDERVKVERERIEAEIDKAWKRGLGPDFTEGMRQNRLEELSDKLDRLNSDPEAYFAGQ
jgi:hypothetical protein